MSKKVEYCLWKNGAIVMRTMAEYALEAKTLLEGSMPYEVYEALRSTDDGYLAILEGDVWEIK